MSTFELLKLTIPGGIAIVGNLIFYWIIKSRLDKKIEQFKITYSGIYGEKIRVYKELLNHIGEFKNLVRTYRYHNDIVDFGQIQTKNNGLLDFIYINKPFFSDPVEFEIKKMMDELRKTSESFYELHGLGKYSVTKEQKEEMLKKFFEASKKINDNYPFKELEEKIVKEIRSDLKILKA